MKRTSEGLEETNGAALAADSRTLLLNYKNCVKLGLPELQKLGQPAFSSAP